MKLLFLIPLLLFSCDGGKPVVTGSPAAVQRGIAKTIAKGQCKGYIVPINPSIELKTGNDVLIEQGIPVIKRDCGAYCHTDFDKGGYITVSGYHDPNANKLVLPYVPGYEAALELAAEYESEHALLLANNRAEYERTRVHTSYAGHPLIPNCQ